MPLGSISCSDAVSEHIGEKICSGFFSVVFFVLGVCFACFFVGFLLLSLRTCFFPKGL